MAVVTGTVAFSDISNLTPEKFAQHMHNLHSDLVTKHGFGIMHTETNTGGGLDWTFTYAEPVHGSEELMQNLTVSSLALSPEQIAAIHHANVVLKNSAGIKRVMSDETTGLTQYVPLTDDKDSPDYDPAAEGACRDINILEALLEPYDYQGKQ